MSIFALDERASHLLALAIPLCIFIVGIHWTIDVGPTFACRIEFLRSSTFVVDWARRIHLLDKVVSILEVLTHTTLVSERPYDD